MLSIKICGSHVDFKIQNELQHHRVIIKKNLRHLLHREGDPMTKVTWANLGALYGQNMIFFRPINLHAKIFGD